MKEINIGALWAVFSELLKEFPSPLPWLVGFLLFAVLVALAWVVWRDRGVDCRRLLWLKLVGVVIALIGYHLVLTLTRSSVGGLGGPIDWIVALGLFGALTVAGMVVTHALWSLVRTRAIHDVKRTHAETARLDRAAGDHARSRTAISE